MALSDDEYDILNSVSKNTITHHSQLLGELRKNGLISSSGFGKNIVYKVTDEGGVRLQTQAAVSSTHFIRLGRWCPVEHSENCHTGVVKPGVSVFACVNVAPDIWLPDYDDAWRSHAACHDATEQDWYLVTGDLVEGIGADEEPLLKNVEFVAVLERKNGLFHQTSRRPMAQIPRSKVHQNCGKPKP